MINKAKVLLIDLRVKNGSAAFQLPARKLAAYRSAFTKMATNVLKIFWCWAEYWWWQLWQVIEFSGRWYGFRRFCLDNFILAHDFTPTPMYVLLQAFLIFIIYCGKSGRDAAWHLVYWVWWYDTREIECYASVITLPQLLNLRHRR